MLDCDYIKKHYKLIAVDFSWQLNADPKAIQQIEFIGQLKKLDNNGNAKDAGNNLCMFVLTILEKIKKTTKLSHENVTVL